MRSIVAAGFAAALLLPHTSVFGQAKAAAAAPVVVIETAKGVIEIETFTDAPKSTEHFVELARKGFYRGQRFHWVQPGIVQTGDPMSRDLTKRSDWGTGGSGPRNAVKPIGVAETSKRKFERGIVGLAYRTDRKAESADSQFFILTGPNPALNGKYAPLGKVIKGIEIVDKIELGDVIKNVSVK
jgi:cyclophilin family peptidyl-prolyl cis-trans isomerase